MADGATNTARRRKAAAPSSTNPVDIAMEAESGDTSADSPARRLLVKQERLVEQQTALTGWQIASERAGFVLRMMIGLGVVAALGALGFMVWTASRSDGLVIKAFSVPPELAARGVTGEALAAQMMDRLNRISEEALSAETQRQVSGDWGQHISIQIPETGVSLSQLDQWLRDKFGHERRFTGEVMRGEDGRLLLVARTGAAALPEQTGAAGELPAMLQKTAEALYAREQPYSFQSYLINTSRWDDLAAFAQTRIAARSGLDRAFGYSALGQALNNKRDVAGAKAAFERSIAIDPAAAPEAMRGLAGIEFNLGHVEAGRYWRERYLAMLRRPGAYEVMSPEAREQRINETEFSLSDLRGDLQASVSMGSAVARRDLLGFGRNGTPMFSIANDYAALHDVPAARAALAEAPLVPVRIEGTQSNIAVALGDWQGALQAIDRAAALPGYNPPVTTTAQRARVLAEMGRIAEAQALIKTTPLDCAPCVQRRGMIAERAGQSALADHWYGAARRMAPSMREAPFEWGKALMRRGELDRAVVQFQAANAFAPKWADPLVYWGEVLLTKGDAVGAAAKFEHAALSAPNWGRLHLKWGEALVKAGKAEEARAEWAKAGKLDLTAAERGELAANLAGKV